MLLIPVFSVPFSGSYLDEQQQVDILRLGSLTVLVANVVLLNVNTLKIREE